MGRVISFACVAVLIGTAGTAAGSSSRPPPGAVPLATPLGITIQTPAGQGYALRPYEERKVEREYFASATGMALYTYDRDGPNRSSCSDECARTWPPLLAGKDARAFGD